MLTGSYEEAVEYIGSIPKFTSKTSLAHTRQLLEILGNPQQDMKILHVAGTNGKGSVCAAMDVMLRAGGYTVGLFTSPHLIRINERFLINGMPADDEAFLKAFTQVMAASEQLMQKGDVHPTYFETLFLMGILLFRDAGADYVILEVGMGGRLDATNVIEKPMACVITSVSLDHTQYLGETIPEIAGEKAGIIKKGVPVVYDAFDPAVNRVIEKRAREIGSPTYPLSRARSRAVSVTEAGTEFLFEEDDGRQQKLRIPQIAAYQMVNAALAWYTLRILENKIVLPQKVRIRALETLSWPCRMQKVAPGAFIDGAHNPDGIAAFIETVQALHTDRECTLLFSAVRDKRYEQMVRELAEGIRPERVVTTRIRDARAASEEELAGLFKQYGCPAVYTEADPGKAWDLALKLQGGGVLFCVGSLYLAGEILEYLQQNAHKTADA
ncbi:MAG: bifunctional folylpolyglutamate synthase/dihydrofolate synthase [Eubacterium sp.]|nr:bifunctional folylpolyglutamate synthase/dihydrofolate synthase [Eubacterium sp.]